MRSSLHDVIVAVRALRRMPALVIAATVSIGLAIGSATTVLSWIESLVLRPYPAIPDAERLVALNVAAPNGDDWPLSYRVFSNWRDAPGVVADLAAWTISRVSVRDAGEQGSSPALAMLVSGNYFRVLGLHPASGRLLAPDDERVALPAVVLSDDYWQRRFGRAPGIVGRNLWLNGQPFHVVGVAPRGFVGTYVGVPADMWVPVTVQAGFAGARNLEDRNARWLQAIGRLAPHADLAMARREMDAMARRSSADHGDRPTTGAITRRPREQFLGGLISPMLLVMLTVAGLVVVVASVNVASLLLVRASARRRELATRAALGATRARVAMPLVAESFVIAALGGVLGTALAFALRGALYAFVPPTPYRVVLPIQFDGRIAAGALALTLAAALFAALMPARRAFTVPPAAVLGAARGTTADGVRLRAALVIGQLSFSLVCLVCAALFIRSLRAALAVEVGFASPENVLLVGTDFAPTLWTDSVAERQLGEVLGRLRALPGVSHAAASTMVPLGFGGHRFVDVRVPGREVRPDENLAAERVLVSDDYFETMGTRLVTGRAIDARDRRGAIPVAVVNETFVRRFLGGVQALGARIDAGRGPVTVVGVVRDGKYADLTEAPAPVAYFPLAQWFAPSFTLHLRTTQPPRLLAGAVRDVLTSAHVDLPAIEPRTLAEHIGAATFVQRLGASVLTAFGGLALSLAAVGLYGVLALGVAARRREFGVRIAMGATRAMIGGDVIRHAIRLTAIGVTLGGAAALGIAQLLRSQLVDVPITDGRAFGAAIGLLVIVALGASWAPAMRATAVDPAIVLREE